MKSVPLKRIGRVTLVYAISGLMVSVELGVLISVVWFYKQGWVIQTPAPTTEDLLKSMSLELTLIVALSVPLVLLHTLGMMRLFKLKVLPPKASD